MGQVPYMAKLVKGKTFMVREENDYSLKSFTVAYTCILILPIDKVIYSWGNTHSSMLVYLYYQLTRSYIHGETLTVACLYTYITN